MAFDPYSALLGAFGGSGGDVTVDTTQQVTQSSNTNVNPLINVQVGRSAAHMDPQTSLSPNTNQSPSVTRPLDSNRTGLPSMSPLLGSAGVSSEYGPYSAASDTKQPMAGANGILSVLMNPTTLLVLGGGFILWYMMK